MAKTYGMTRHETKAAICSGVLRACPRARAIVVFGSFARGNTYHDIDLLVVVPRLTQPPLARTPTIQAIRKSVEIHCPLDVILVSAQECHDGFQSHLPLFLDIAFDGRVLYGDGFIRQWIARARRYVRSKGVRRTATGGWRFPVRLRESTPLSIIKNDEWANIWLNDARRDLQAAELLLRAGLYERCVTHCQQTAEKSVKAVLACLGGFEPSHYVSSVLRAELEQLDSLRWRKRLMTLADQASSLEPDATLSRYARVFQGKIVIPAEHYDRKAARAALKKAKNALKISQTFISWWFKQVP